MRPHELLIEYQNCINRQLRPFRSRVTFCDININKSSDFNCCLQETSFLCYFIVLCSMLLLRESAVYLPLW